MEELSTPWKVQNIIIITNLRIRKINSLRLTMIKM